jgi:hypothetical protein
MRAKEAELRGKAGAGSLLLEPLVVVALWLLLKRTVIPSLCCKTSSNNTHANVIGLIILIQLFLCDIGNDPLDGRMVNGKSGCRRSVFTDDGVSKRSILLVSLPKPAFS